MGLAVDGLGAHVEPTAVEEDAEAVGDEGTEAAGDVLNGLDFAVETLSHGVGDGISEVGQQLAQVIFERAGDAFDCREFAAAGAGTPLFEERSTLVAILLLPEAGEVLLGQPGSGGLQIALCQTLEVHCMFFRQCALAVEPPEAGVLERVISLRGQLLGFDTTYFVNRLTQQLGDMKLVMHQLGLRHLAVHGSRHGRLGVLALGYLEHDAAVQVAADGHVALAAPETLLTRLRLALTSCLRQAIFAALRFIKPEVIHPRPITTRRTPLDRTLHDASQTRPFQPQQIGRGRQTRTSLEDLQRMIFKGQRPPRVALGLRHHSHLGRSIRALQTRHPHPDRLLTLYGVQMAPFPLFPYVHLGCASLAVFPPPRLLDANLQLHSLVLQVQLHAAHKLRRLQLNCPIEKLSVFHPPLLLS